jgi:hypothetical protein
MRLENLRDAAVAAMIEAGDAAQRQAVLEAQQSKARAWLRATLGTQPLLLLTMVGGSGVKAGVMRRAVDGLTEAELDYLAAARDVAAGAVRHLRPGLREQVADNVDDGRGFLDLLTTPTELVVTWKPDPAKPSLEIARLSLIGSSSSTRETAH